MFFASPMATKMINEKPIPQKKTNKAGDKMRKLGKKIVDSLYKMNNEFNRMGPNQQILQLRKWLQEYKDTQLDNTFSRIWPGHILPNLTHRIEEHQALNIVIEFLNAGADVNEADDLGGTPLKYSTADRSLAMCKLFLKSGAKLDAPGNRAMSNALHMAVSKGMYDFTVVLLDEYDKQGVTIQWWTMVRLAMRQGHEACAMLIASKEYHLWMKPVSSRQNIFNLYEENPLEFSPYKSFFHMAASKGYVNLTKLLIDQDPRVLQEKWLVKNQISLELSLHQELVAMLQNYRRHPIHLTWLCKYVILKRLRPNAYPKIAMLPLPKILKAFVAKRSEVLYILPWW